LPDQSTIRQKLEEHPPTDAEFARRLVLAAVMMASFMTAVNISIVATAMPTIVAELGGFQLFSWTFAAYLLAQAVTIPIYGRLADFYGRKRVLLAGVSLFLLGSALCGMAWDMMPLIAFRGLQGAGAGAVLPIATTIVGDIYSPADRARIQGYISGVWGIAAFFATLRQTAEQLTDLDRWYRILSRALAKYLKGHQLDPPRRLQEAV
jgi:MFS family permease